MSTNRVVAVLPPLLRFVCIFLPQFSGMERANPRAVLVQVLSELPEADVMLPLSKEEICYNLSTPSWADGIGFEHF